jgi:hypothetical protein
LTCTDTAERCFFAENYGEALLGREFAAGLDAALASGRAGAPQLAGRAFGKGFHAEFRKHFVRCAELLASV